MKGKILAIAAMLTLVLASCGSKSQASREQISNAHEEAHAMLDQLPDTVAASVAKQ